VDSRLEKQAPNSDAHLLQEAPQLLHADVGGLVARQPGLRGGWR
jgi:hypothetical protein